MLLRIQGYGGVSTGGGGGGGSAATATFSPDTTTHYANPERGPYAWIFNDGGSWLQQFTASSMAGFRSMTIPRSIVAAFIDLRGLHATPTLPGSVISQCSTGLGYIRSAGLKVFIRICYNYASGGNDPSLSIAQGHVQQLAGLFAANDDVIFNHELGVFGDFAEFHDGSSGNAQNQAAKLAIMQTYMDNTPAGTQLMARYPADIQTWFPTVLTEAQYLAGLTSPTYQSRLGMFDDGYLAGPSNSGTFDGRPGATGGFTIAQRRAYTAALSALTLCGGEVTTYAGTPYRTGDSDATGDGAAQHMGFLNFETSSGPDFFTAWNSTGIINTVARLYGYRIQLDSVTYQTTAARGATTPVSAALRNYGYARVPKARQLVASLRHTSTGETYTAALGDLRRLPSVATSSTALAGNVTVPSGATTGNYALLLSAPDVAASLASDTRQAMRFANANAGGAAWDASTARFNTGVTVAVA